MPSDSHSSCSAANFRCIAPSSKPHREEVTLTTPSGSTCEVPFNMPGIHDSLRKRSYAPPISVPQSSRCPDSSIAQSIVVLRVRWPFNFGEATARLLEMASALLSLPQPLTILVPGLPAGLPAFYHDLLAPLGRVESDARALVHSTFTAATFCCLDADDLSAPSKTGDAPIMHSLNTSAVKDLLTRIRRHHLGRAYSSPLRPIGPLPRLPLAASSASSSHRIALIERAPPSPATSAMPSSAANTDWLRTHASRAIANAAQLLVDCEKHSRAGCIRLKPPPLEPFAAALETLASTHVLIGMHGAGLVNAVFLPPGATVVEIFPRRFSAPGSFGWEKHTWLRQLGLRRLRMLADEVSLQGCVSPEERKARVWARMRDCDVTVSWRDVERALSRPDPISTTYMPFEGGHATDEQLTRRDIERAWNARKSGKAWSTRLVPVYEADQPLEERLVTNPLVPLEPLVTNPLVPHALGLEVTAAARRAIERPSECVPPKAILLSCFNAHHRQLHAEQLRAVGSLACLTARVVLVCFGGSPPTDAARTSVRCVPGPAVPPSDHKQAAYHQITWAKWSLAYYAMHAAESVLLLDADVAVLRNPFTPGLTSRDEDLLYQQEHVGHERTPFTPSHRPEARARGPKRPGVPWALFGSPVNTGQLYVRSRALVERVMRAMPPTADADPRLEQEIVFEDVLQNRSEGWRASGLPDRYAGHCWYEPRRLPWSSLLTYHAHCENTSHAKVEWMRIAIKASTGPLATAPTCARVMCGLEYAPCVGRCS